MSDAVDEQLARQAITAQLYRYCRGVDRMDLELARSCWHPDGTADYREMFEGSADALLDWMWSTHRQMQGHSHQITNALVELQGERAASEAYVTVALRTAGAPGTCADIITRGRYLDRWSRRDDTWAIDHRIYVTDLCSLHPVAEDPPARATGTRDPQDPSYAILGG